MKKQILIIVPLLGLLFLLIVRGAALFDGLRINVGNSAVYRSFSQEQTSAGERQRALAVAAEAFNTERMQESANPVGSSMIAASLRGLYYQRQGQWQAATGWFETAARTTPSPQRQQQLLVSPWMAMTESGDFILDALQEPWRVRADAPPGVQLSATTDGALRFDCQEIAETPRKAALAWNHGFAIPYHHTLQLKARTEPGTTLNLETVIDGQLQRHLTHRGNGRWETFTIPLEGDYLRFIYIIVREDGESDVRSCSADIESLTFSLDEPYRDDRPR